MEELEETEIWSTPDSLDGSIEVSNLGRIRVKSHINSCGHLIKQHYIRAYYGGTRKGVYIKFRGKRYAIKRIIAKEFLPNPNNYPHVLSKDGNPLNLRVDNLYWGKFESKPRNRYHKIPKSDFDKMWEHRFDHQKQKRKPGGGRPRKKGTE